MMNDKYPIIKLDRTTVQEFLPVLMNKGIFSNFESLPTRDEILQNEKCRLGLTQLSPDEVRNALHRAGRYKTEKNVARDFGDYIIVFSAREYLKSINEEFEITDVTGNLQDELTQALPKIKLYKLAHNIVLLILAKVYNERKFTDLEISKSEILDGLGYTTNDKQIYSDINDVMFSLRWLTYRIIKRKKGVNIDPNFRAEGTFIYNIIQDSKRFIIDVNKKFVGCVGYLFNDKQENNKDLFRGGYLTYPTSLIPMTRGYSPAAYSLTNFLIFESGNSKLKQPGLKVVAFKIKHFMSQMNLHAGRPARRKAEFLKALQEVEIIQNLHPRIDCLTNINPTDLEETVLHIYLKSGIKALDKEIKSNL